MDEGHDFRPKCVLPDCAARGRLMSPSLCQVHYDDAVAQMMNTGILNPTGSKTALEWLAETVGADG